MRTPAAAAAAAAVIHICVYIHVCVRVCVRVCVYQEGPRMSVGDPYARQASVPFYVCARAAGIEKDVKCP